MKGFFIGIGILMLKLALTKLPIIEVIFYA